MFLMQAFCRPQSLLDLQYPGGGLGGSVVVVVDALVVVGALVVVTAVGITVVV